ncbi:MAG: MBL fold metallo-hydrolase [Pseudomonadota bacterium]
MSKELELTFHGAAKTVTGSCLEFSFGGKNILVDCGLYQGSRSLERLNHAPFEFDAANIDAVVLTHAHIDHSGLLPKLVAQGFKGAIWCTKQTQDLLEYMLADAGRIQESEALRRNRRRDRAEYLAITPTYTEADAIAAWQMTETAELGEWFAPVSGFSARFWNAGHILGSASVELLANGVNVLCSGDLGPDNKSFQQDPSGKSGFDHVICESTYGDRAREQITAQQRKERLQLEIAQAMAMGGNLVIPSFALERTQELLLDIGKLAVAGQIDNVKVFIDSPLANQITKVFAAHSGQLADTDGTNIFGNSAFHFVEDVNVSKKLNTVKGAIILAASGMCEAGRIRHHLLHNLPDKNSTILFVGFQALGSLGRTIFEGAKRVRISGRDVSVRAKIRQIEGYSAHADQSELLEWIEERRPINGSLFLNHGEAQAIDLLRDIISAKNPLSSIITPEIGEIYELKSCKSARRLKTGNMEIQNALGKDWQNAYADFAVNLKQELAKIKTEAARQKAIEEMRLILESYAEHKKKR